MFHRREIELPRDVSFYTQDREFKLVVDASACGTHTSAAGVPFVVPHPIVIQKALTKADKTLTASVNDLTRAALRFYRTGGVNQFELSSYDAELFLTRYHWGRSFARSVTNSLERASGSERVYHSEALKVHSEMLAYGVAVHFLAELLAIPIDRFFFISKSGSRPDFRARVTQTELLASSGSVGALSSSGSIVNLEVKYLHGWATFRSNGSGKGLLENLAKKAAAEPTKMHVCIGVGLPSTSPTQNSLAKVLIADPGEPIPLGRNEQAILLLEEALVLLHRHGLWPALAHALAWLLELRGELTMNEKELESQLEVYRDIGQYRIILRDAGNRLFNGREFSDVVARLGQVGARGMSRTEAQERLDMDSLGRVFYSGVDVEWLNVIEARDLESLLHYGVGIAGRSIHSAFFYEEVPMQEEERLGVRRDLRLALNRW